MTSADYFSAMIFITPALCSLVCVLLVVMLTFDYRNSAELGLRLTTIAISLIISTMWFALLIVEHSSWAHGGNTPTVFASPVVKAVLWIAVPVIPSVQVWFTWYVIRRGLRGAEKFSMPNILKKSGDIPGNGENGGYDNGETDGELTRQRIEEYFHRNRPWLAPDFKLTDLAVAMGVNRSEISAFINQTFGMGFKRYVNRWRLAEYERLMNMPSNDLKNPYKIVVMAGFSDTRHYHRVVEMEKMENE